MDKKIWSLQCVSMIKKFIDDGSRRLLLILDGFLATQLRIWVSLQVQHIKSTLSLPSTHPPASSSSAVGRVKRWSLFSMNVEPIIILTDDNMEMKVSSYSKELYMHNTRQAAASAEPQINDDNDGVDWKFLPDTSSCGLWWEALLPPPRNWRPWRSSEDICCCTSSSMMPEKNVMKDRQS